jgi:tetratricopeptide (TPR) repeat protein
MEHPTVKCIEHAYALRSERRFEECLRVLNERKRSETDAELLDCLVLAEANCYLNMPDLDLAESSLDSIDIQSATKRVCFSVDSFRGQLCHMKGNLADARSLFQRLLANLEIERDPEYTELKNETAARLGFVLADLGELQTALSLLDRSDMAHLDMDLLHDASLYKAYCLQGLNRFSEAESVLTLLLKDCRRASSVPSAIPFGLCEP